MLIFLRKSFFPSVVDTNVVSAVLGLYLHFFQSIDISAENVPRVLCVVRTNLSLWQPGNPGSFHL